MTYPLDTVRAAAGMRARAKRHACTHPYDPRYPPHSMRCDFVTSDGRRCTRYEHHEGQHDLPKP